jgi:hypothetical protein
MTFSPKPRPDEAGAERTTERPETPKPLDKTEETVGMVGGAEAGIVKVGVAKPFDGRGDSRLSP